MRTREYPPQMGIQTAQWMQKWRKSNSEELDSMMLISAGDAGLCCPTHTPSTQPGISHGTWVPSWGDEIIGGILDL